MKIGLFHVLVAGCVVYVATRGGTSPRRSTATTRSGPPWADVIGMWGKERVPFFYGYYRSFLQGLVHGKRLTADAAQQELTRTWDWLESIDPNMVVTLDPWLVSRW